MIITRAMMNTLKALLEICLEYSNNAMQKKLLLSVIAILDETENKTQLAGKIGGRIGKKGRPKKNSNKTETLFE